MQVDQFVDFASQLVAGAGLESACAALNDYLAVRTFLVGYSLTAADVACWGQLEGVCRTASPTDMHCIDQHVHGICLHGSTCTCIIQ